MGFIQNELDRVARHWNTHCIRPYPNQETPPGRPDVLYHLSETRGVFMIMQNCSVLLMKLCNF